MEQDFLTFSMRYVGHNGTVVEVGSWMGTSSQALAKGILKYCHGAKLYCVDIFDSSYYASTPGLEKGAKKDIRKIFEKNMRDYPHITLQEDSILASKRFSPESVDFLFIDGNHSYEGVKADIEAWHPKLKPGAILCGHDFGGGYDGVTKAVKERFLKFSLPARTIWQVSV